jgi:hypothetical protein
MSIEKIGTSEYWNLGKIFFLESIHMMGINHMFFSHLSYGF